MTTLLLLMVALALPFGDVGPHFTVGSLQMDTPSIFGVLAVAWLLMESLKRNIRPDMAGWSAICWAGAWLVSSLATHSGPYAQAASAAWILAAGPLIFALSRNLLSPRQRAILLAAMGLATSIFIVRIAFEALAIASGPANSLHYSQDTTKASAWTPALMTPSITSKVRDPMGGMTANIWLEKKGKGMHALKTRNIIPAYKTQVLSGYFKGGLGRTYVHFYLENERNSCLRSFDLDKGIALSGWSSDALTLVTSSIMPVGNTGWYRCMMVVSAPASYNLTWTILTGVGDGGDTGYSYVGDSSKGVYAWGLMFQYGFPPEAPYIATGGFAPLGASWLTTILHFFGRPGTFVQKKQSIRWCTFIGNPFTGGGPAAFPYYPLWKGLLPNGGILVVTTVVFLLWSLGLAIYRLPRRKIDSLGDVPPALLLLALVISGFIINPLSNTGLGLGFWLFLTALLPSTTPPPGQERNN